MRVRVLHALTLLRADGGLAEQFEVGSSYEVTTLLGASLLTEGWAVREDSPPESPAEPATQLQPSLPTNVEQSPLQPQPPQASQDEGSPRRPS